MQIRLRDRIKGKRQAAMVLLMLLTIIIFGCGQDTVSPISRGETLDTSECGVVYWAFGPGEKSICSKLICEDRTDAGGYSGDDECDWFTPGQQGKCDENYLCNSKCLCEKISESEEFKEYVDKDMDGYCVGNPDEPYYYGKDGCNGFADCNDENSKVHPDALELCDNIDNNCNLETDEGEVCKQNLYVCGEEAGSTPKDCALWCYYETGGEAVEKCEVLGETEKGSFVCCEIPYESVREDMHGINDLDKGKSYPAFIYVCDSEECDASTPLFKETKFYICEDSESVCDDGLDNDCDGSIDDDDYDCGVCNPTQKYSRCDLLEHKMCIDDGSGEGMLTEVGYCIDCSWLDEMCVEQRKECAPDELSCDGGCRVGACDTYADKFCAEGGYWATAGYEEACAQYDSEHGDVECVEGSCDNEMDMSCWMDVMVDELKWNSNKFCTGEDRCGLKKDSGCGGPCEPGSCDIYANAYCTGAGTWGTDDYCSHCGAIDSDCGIKEIEEGACNYLTGSVYTGGQWRELNFGGEYCDQCDYTEVPDDDYHCHPQGEAENEIEEWCIDGRDNDLDGFMDCLDPDCSELHICTRCHPEGYSEKCGTDIGSCEIGERSCTDGIWTPCIGSIEPVTEYCDRYDNDCDASIDEDCTGCKIGETSYCGSEEGRCGGGVQECKLFGTEGKWGGCFGPTFTTPADEVCDGRDNDCDGEIDEGCPCVEGETQLCGEDPVGICVRGRQTCDNGFWGDCEGAVMPMKEVCDDNLDNDCDGLSDMADDACSNTEATSGLSPSCDDHIKNSDEEAIDCGGEECMPCDQVTCYDGRWNGYEDGVDCGGEECDSCPEYGAERTTEGPDDDTTATKRTSKKDDEKKKLPFTLLALIFIAILIVLFITTTFVQMKKSGKPFGETVKGMFGKKPPAQKPSAFSFGTKPAAGKPAARPATASRSQKPKVTKSREEAALDESMKKSNEMFK
ncbi:MAG: putative metal-binding motif-containing protein [Candidatus Woesearchaeota archaeon]